MAVERDVKDDTLHPRRLHAMFSMKFLAQLAGAPDAAGFARLEFVDGQQMVAVPIDVAPDAPFGEGERVDVAIVVGHAIMPRGLQRRVPQTPSLPPRADA